MIEQKYISPLVAGFERMSAWKTLLNNINVFPVADGDTGINMVNSLAPLRRFEEDQKKAVNSMIMGARGNSGNIASLFFSGMLTEKLNTDLAGAIDEGRKNAYRAVKEPRKGTMLTFYDDLYDSAVKHGSSDSAERVQKITDDLIHSVKSTRDQITMLKDAGVIDSGALGMFIFFETFLKATCSEKIEFCNITDTFAGYLSVADAYTSEGEDGYCVDMVVEEKGSEKLLEDLKQYGDSAITITEGGYVKIHLHTDNRETLRERVQTSSKLVHWTTDNLTEQQQEFSQMKRSDSAVHIVTDAAGSMTRKTAIANNITLLDSYISIGDIVRPETAFTHEELYPSMKRGLPVSTSQASNFERSQNYQSLVETFGRVLYLCVGSYYTGNFDAAETWKKENDKNNSFRVIDTTAASGRLALIALAVAEYAKHNDDFDAIEKYALEMIESCSEYIFLDRLEYLARGGRLSKGKAFFGDMLSKKPVISPLAEGATKVGIVKNEKEQFDFAMKKLEENLEKGSSPLILLEYSDNQNRVAGEIQRETALRYPAARIILTPFSLTTGAHTGPGTWAVAMIPGKALYKKGSG